MLLDTQNLFSDAQAITTGPIDSQNIVKFGKSDVSFVPIIIQAVSDFSKLTSLTVKVVTSDTSDFTSSKVLAESKLELVDLKAGARFPISYLPKGNLGYIKLTYTVAGDTAETTGKITAGVVASNELSYHDM